MRELVEPGVEELQHRCAMAVCLLVLPYAPQVLFAERADAVPQVTERQLVVVGYRQLFSHGTRLPGPSARQPDVSPA